MNSSNDIFAVARGEIIDPSSLTRKELLKAIFWLNQEIRGNVICGRAGEISFVEHQIKNTRKNSKANLIARFNDMIDELIAVNPYSYLLRVYRIE